MKIVVALDKFKGSIGAVQASRVVAETLRKMLPAADVIEKPLADGGDGTAEILLACCGGEWITKTVTGPLPHMRIRAGYARLANPRVCVVEMASASGLALLRNEERNPMLASTLGTGELLAAAFRECMPVWLAVGGSATVDCGVGAARALGWNFLDKEDRSVEVCGGQLHRIVRIVPPAAHDWPEVAVLCDVTNPLCGPRGAAHFFGPQKGATPEMVEQLESGMQHFAALLQRTFGKDLLSMPGGGAAGGLPVGASAFFGARLRSGIELISEAVGLREAVADADWVVTGEGSFDEQSLGGKVVSGVLTAAHGSGAKIAIIAGRVEITKAQCDASGINSTYSLTGPDVTVERAIGSPAEILAMRASEFARACRQPG